MARRETISCDVCGKEQPMVNGNETAYGRFTLQGYGTEGFVKKIFIDDICLDCFTVIYKAAKYAANVIRNKKNEN